MTIETATALLPQRGLRAARAAWLVFAALALATFAAAIPARWAQLAQPRPVTLANLHALGLSVSSYALYLMATEILFTVVYVAIGGLIFLRSGAGRMALLAALFLVAYGVGNQTITPVVEALRGLHPALDFVVNTLAYVAWICFGGFLWLFPSGRFVPAWMRWPGLLWLLVCIPYNYAIGTPYYVMNWPVWLALPPLTLVWLSWLGSQVHRYRRVSGPVERQQTKWVVFGVAAMIGVIIVEIGAIALLPNVVKPQWLLGGEPASPVGLGIFLIWLGVIRLAFLSLPVTVVVSIFRYRLWDIDRLINRAIVYVALTGTLALVYFGSVIILQKVVEAVTGQTTGSPLAVVGSTLSIAALFAPLRRRMQDSIDRRFYRRKYDAAQTLAAFGAVARDETNLERLTGELIRVISETVQPATASLWLRPQGAEIDGPDPAARASREPQAG